MTSLFYNPMWEKEETKMPEPIVDTTVTDSVEDTDQVENTEEVELSVEELKNQLAEKDAKIQKLNDENAKRRLAEKNAKKTKVDPNDAVASAVAERDSHYKNLIVSNAVKSTLIAEGIEDPSILIQLIKTDDLDVDEDGSVIGLDDQITELKTKLPTLFTTKLKKNVANAAGAGTKGAAPKEDHAEERQLLRNLFSK